MVDFFALSEEAERSGFRPCRRCRPDQFFAPKPDVQKIRAACQLIDSRLAEPLTLKAIGEAVGLSPFHLQRSFKRLIGITPREYQNAGRINRFKTQVRKGKNVTEALYDAGYGSSSRLYERGNSELGMTPSSYRKQGLGVEIAYAIADSPLGCLLVAATGRGVCSVAFGQSPEDLEAGLKREFSAALICRDDAGLGEFTAAIVGHLQGRGLKLDLPTDIKATAFQRKVWDVLRSIPYGQSRTYGDIAREIGSPGAVRAVGRACATNPVALVIPCHRAIQKGGGLGGYRWGVDRKQKLLARESARKVQEPSGRTPGEL
jgi:AraC family transcriptional regulator of adaptative response/methylated-DNA-[protein]-cysteine methyltransferase